MYFIRNYQTIFYLQKYNWFLWILCFSYFRKESMLIKVQRKRTSYAFLNNSERGLTYNPEWLPVNYWTRCRGSGKKMFTDAHLLGWFKAVHLPRSLPSTKVIELECYVSTQAKDSTPLTRSLFYSNRGLVFFSCIPRFHLLRFCSRFFLLLLIFSRQAFSV